VLLTTAACSPGPVPRLPGQSPANPTPAPAVTAAEPSGDAAAEAAWLELTRSSSATTFPALQSARVRCQPDGMLVSGYASPDKSPIDIDPTSAVRLESGADFVGWLGVDGTRWFETVARPAGLSVAAFTPDGSMVLRRTDRTDRPSRSAFSLRELDGHEQLLRDGSWASADVAFAPDGDIYMASSPMYRQKANRVEELSPSVTRLDRTGRARWTIEPKHAELAGCGEFSRIFSRSDGSVLFVGAGRGRVRYGTLERQLVGRCIQDTGSSSVMSCTSRPGPR
jgi:hypothetical protein